MSSSFWGSGRQEPFPGRGPWTPGRLTLAPARGASTAARDPTGPGTLWDRQYFTYSAPVRKWPAKESLEHGRRTVEATGFPRVLTLLVVHGEAASRLRGRANRPLPRLDSRNGERMKWEPRVNPRNKTLELSPVFLAGQLQVRLEPEKIVGGWTVRHAGNGLGGRRTVLP